MAIIYAIPNYECNLSCPHCDISRQHVDYDEQKFLYSIKDLSNNKTNVINLFGGEPTLYKERFMSIVKTNLVSSVSTNLLATDAEVLDCLVHSSFSIATSWNKTRFTAEQEQKWLKNLELFSESHKKCMVLITMTPDLVYSPLDQIIDVLNRIDSTRGVDSILFEHLISDTVTDSFQQDCDSWLCSMHDCWKWPKLNNRIEEKVKANRWKFDCSSTKTILPNGELRDGCPQKTSTCICLECLSCKNSSFCQPCSLQRFCTFPKKLYKKLTEDVQN